MPYNKDEITGWLGLAPQGRAILADTEGFFGFSAGKATNVIFNITAPQGSGGQVRDLILRITYAGQATPEEFPYDAAFIYERQVPTNTPITLETFGGVYPTTTNTFTVAPNSIYVLNVPLAFNGAYAVFSRRRFF